MFSLALAAIVAACPPNAFCNTTGPAATDALFNAVVLGPNDAWAFGWGAALHWDGTSWVSTKLPVRDRFDSAVALAPNDVWVTGNDSVLHWDGASWSSVDRGSTSGFAGPVVEVSPGTVWVLGSTVLRVEKGALVPLGAQSPKGLAEPSLALDASACGPNDLWIARRGDESKLVLTHWDGTRVTRLERPENGQLATTACVDKVLWVTLEYDTLACTGTSCRRVDAPRGSRILKNTTGPWVIAPEGLHRWDGKRFEKKADAPGRWFGGAGRGDDDVVLVGDVGSTARFDGATLSIAPRVDLGRVSSLSVSREGEPWVKAETGLHVFRNGAWTRIKSFPGKGRQGRVWADSATHLWVVDEGRAWRWGGAKWAELSTGRDFVDVWGRGEGEVFFTTGRRLLRWNGKKFETVAEAPKGWDFTSLAGDAERLAVLVRGPRPEATDRPSTGLPDRVLIVEKGKQRTLALSGRPEQLAWVKGELWSVGAGHFGEVMRLADDEWARVAEGAGSCIVPTATGAVIANTAGGVEWDGASMKKLALPMGTFEVGGAAGQTVWLAGENAVLRRDSARSAP